MALIVLADDDAELPNTLYTVHDVLNDFANDALVVWIAGDPVLVMVTELLRVVLLLPKLPALTLERVVSFAPVEYDKIRLAL